ncbi:PREDICTED: uncharacterized protein LOC109225749 isoform X1 [Nicotiana attenuata]|uniref:uncharacterized protein LOC109225749 isoform X1 n=1 Tax=Nicotiana attenuata TaxID=49451 RepID=UPI000905B3AE|nr:PREDICTED: uncharacterized protein LOC109225749 isoform X1 [Nicotiana attenuata]
MAAMSAVAMAMASPSPHLLIHSPHSSVGAISKNILSSHSAIYPATAVTYQGLLNHCIFSRGCLRSLVKPVFAAGSGLEASVADDEALISVKNAKVAVESQDAEKIHVRVDVDKEDTRIVFEKVLANLARSAPPVPGFRREKGGKTSKVPRDFLLQILGEDRVTNFVIWEIVTSTLADYVKKENLSVKDNKISTTQTADELKSSFTIGAEFGFNATLELEDAKTEATT